MLPKKNLFTPQGAEQTLSLIAKLRYQQAELLL